MIDSVAEELSHIFLFRDLTSHQLEIVSRLATRREVPAKFVLIAQDKPTDSLYIIVSGSVKICTKPASHTDVVVAIRGPGAVIGEMSLLDGYWPSATVITKEPSVLYCLERTSFWGEIWDMPPVPYNVVCLLSWRLRMMTHQVETLSYLDVRGRLARHLLLLALENSWVDSLTFSHPMNPVEAPIVEGTPNVPNWISKLSGNSTLQGGTSLLTNSVLIPFPLTQSELADLAGTTREQANRLLTHWKRRGYISIDEKHRITVLNAEALYRLGF